MIDNNRQLEDSVDGPMELTWKLCDALLLVSEINIETGSTEQLSMAVDDLNRCLMLQDKALPAQRKNEKAETYVVVVA